MFTHYIRKSYSYRLFYRKSPIFHLFVLVFRLVLHSFCHLLNISQIFCKLLLLCSIYVAKQSKRFLFYIFYIVSICKSPIRQYLFTINGRCKWSLSYRFSPFIYNSLCLLSKIVLFCRKINTLIFKILFKVSNTLQITTIFDFVFALFNVYGKFKCFINAHLLIVDL